MGNDKLIKLVGDVFIFATAIYALDGVARFMNDYQETKARLDALEQPGPRKVVRIGESFHEATTRTRAAGRKKNEPSDAVPQDQA